MAWVPVYASLITSLSLYACVRFLHWFHLKTIFLSSLRKIPFAKDSPCCHAMHICIAQLLLQNVVVARHECSHHRELSICIAGKCQPIGNRSPTDFSFHAITGRKDDEAESWKILRDEKHKMGCAFRGEDSIAKLHAAPSCRSSL